jgi:hypothetical protein
VWFTTGFYHTPTIEINEVREKGCSIGNILYFICNLLIYYVVYCIRKYENKQKFTNSRLVFTMTTGCPVGEELFSIQPVCLS